MLLLTIAGIWILSVIFIMLFMKGAKGCGGNCNQGRLPCDCGYNK